MSWAALAAHALCGDILVEGAIGVLLRRLRGLRGAMVERPAHKSASGCASFLHPHVFRIHEVLWGVPNLLGSVQWSMAIL